MLRRGPAQDCRGPETKNTGCDDFFPNRIRVRNREMEFFVPATFLGGPAQEQWAYTVLVTGADVEQAGRILNFSPGSFTLMVMGLASGRATEGFGIINRGDVNQPPVVDVLASSVDAQKRALSDYDVVAHRLATVAGVSPAGGGPVSGLAAEDAQRAARRRAGVGGGVSPAAPEDPWGDLTSP
jgi:C-terminal binding-module, SLH-like, of glucodextranase